MGTYAACKLNVQCSMLLPTAPSRRLENPSYPAVRAGFRCMLGRHLGMSPLRCAAGAGNWGHQLTFLPQGRRHRVIRCRLTGDVGDQTQSTPNMQQARLVKIKWNCKQQSTSTCKRTRPNHSGISSLHSVLYNLWATCSGGSPVPLPSSLPPN